MTTIFIVGLGISVMPILRLWSRCEPCHDGRILRLLSWINWAAGIILGLWILRDMGTKLELLSPSLPIAHKVPNPAGIALGAWFFCEAFIGVIILRTIADMADEFLKIRDVQDKSTGWSSTKP